MVGLIKRLCDALALVLPLQAKPERTSYNNQWSGRGTAGQLVSIDESKPGDDGCRTFGLSPAGSGRGLLSMLELRPLSGTLND
jgi:hypothetical protein